MGERLSPRYDPLRIPYMGARLVLILIAVMMFFPGLSPSYFIQTSGQYQIKATSALFTNGISYSSLTKGLDLAFRMNWISESGFKVLFAACAVFLLGVVSSAVGSCMSLGNLRMKNLAKWLMFGGGIGMALGIAGIMASYTLIVQTANTDYIGYDLPVGAWIFLVVTLLYFVFSGWVLVVTPKAPAGQEMELPGKYQLFLMLMPFLALVFAFSYLPLYSWRYAFFDYQAGDTLTMDKFVGLKWFQFLVQNSAYVTRLLRVLKNTLIMSGLGILTSWVPMAFAILLSEARSGKFKRFVQTFTTIPNFISWVLVYAIAFAIFNTDGFINTLLSNITGASYNSNYLADPSYSYIKMLLWGMWKGVGWSAIIYISGIAGIDQQLYEAATVDGAGRFQKMWHITIPGLLPTFVVMLVMSIAGILSNGMDQYLVFSNHDNKDVLEVLDLYVYNLGIDDGQIALSTVVGMSKSLISVGLLFVANTVSKWIRGNGVV